MEAAVSQDIYLLTGQCAVLPLYADLIALLPAGLQDGISSVCCIASMHVDISESGMTATQQALKGVIPQALVRLDRL